MPKVFVTGPDGLLGSNIVRELISRNYNVVALVLKGVEPHTLSGLPIDIVYGDVTDLESLVNLSKGCEYFIHIAAVTDTWPSRGAHYFKVNVEGTRNAIEAALRNKVKRFVHVGSASSFGYGSFSEPGDESSAFKSHKYKLDYINSKKDGQNLVNEAIIKRALPGIIVCPTFMIGPYDAKPSSGALVIAIAKNKLPGLASGGKNWVAVKDVAVASCNALTMGKVGSSYILGGENIPYKDAVKRIAAALGQKSHPTIVVPDFLLKFVGWLGSVIARFSSRPPGISFAQALIACDNHYFSNEKAVKELNMPFTPLETAVVELRDWFKENGYL
ncbi:MAG: NAD-dependent epimerase/dehydratase family protein [Bacteroidales bacterium]|nr:NAD-dependent epimerase/dehydratase family protein [Bacteroidales bacterium]